MRSYTCPICHSVFAEADEQWDRLQASGFRCPACTRIPRRRLARIGLGLLVIGMTSCLNAMYTPFDERMRFLRQPNTVLEAWLRQQAPQPGSSMQQVRSFTERKGWKEEEPGAANYLITDIGRYGNFVLFLIPIPNPVTVRAIWRFDDAGKLIDATIDKRGLDF